MAVIGAGPKAAAIAAKAWCLRQTGIPIHVTIFEAHEVGAAWTGRHGYTDGEQRLCTPAERDLGFPYGKPFGPVVASLMQANFSWMAFKASRPSRTEDYADWVNRGRKPPTHAEFAAYLADAIARSQAQLFADGPVSGLRRDAGRWTVIQEVAGRRLATPGFDGVVVTGPGPAATRFPKPARHRRVVDGANFWTERHRLLRDLARRDRRVVIVGGGGTAAAIAAWLVANRVTRGIVILLNQATLFTRTANFFENRLYDDLTAWQALGANQRNAFAARLNRSVVWESVTELLADARNLVLTPGVAGRVRSRRGHGPNDLAVELEGVAGELGAGLVVDAAGFDSRWFADLAVDPGLRTAIRAVTADTAGVDVHLALRIPGFPGLHAPWLSEGQGPGFMTLMVLGDMADHVLAAYLR